MNKLSVGVPFKDCEKFFEDKNIIATREDEAVAVATGFWLAGGEPTVYMQNSGLGNSIDIITSLLKPYGIEFPIVVQHRDSPEHHAFMGKIDSKLMEIMEYESFTMC